MKKERKMENIYRMSAELRCDKENQNFVFLFLPTMS